MPLAASIKRKASAARLNLPDAKRVTRGSRSKSSYTYDEDEHEIDVPYLPLPSDEEMHGLNGFQNPTIFQGAEKIITRPHPGYQSGRVIPHRPEMISTQGYREAVMLNSAISTAQRSSSTPYTGARSALSLKTNGTTPMTGSAFAGLSLGDGRASGQFLPAHQQNAFQHLPSPQKEGQHHQMGVHHHQMEAHHNHQNQESHQPPGNDDICIDHTKLSGMQMVQIAPYVSGSSDRGLLIRFREVPFGLWGDVAKFCVV